MTSILNKSNVLIERITISKDETHHLYSGIPLYKRIFTSVMSFHPPGIAAVRDGNEAYHIDFEGKPLYQERFIKSFGFYAGIAAVVDESGWFHIDIKGKSQYTKTFDWVGNFQEELCPVRDKNGNYFHIKKDGSSLYNEKYKYAGDFKYGIAVVYDHNGYAQHIDKSGDLLHQKRFNELGVFHKGFATAKDNHGGFHVDKKGEQLYEARYRWVEPFYNGYAFVCKKNGEKLIIDEQGQIAQEILNQDSSKIQNELRKHLMGELVGYWKTQIIHSIVELEICEIIKTGKKTFNSLLKASQLPNSSLKIIIQVLKIWDFINEENGEYYLKYLGNLLTEDHSKSLKYAALMWGEEHYQNMTNLTEALKDYKPKFKKVFGQSIFEYFDFHKEKGRIFNKAMKAYSLDYDNVIQLYNFAETKIIMDVGGGSGSLLEKIISQNNHIEKGVLIDLSSTIENVRKTHLKKDLREKIEFISGDFFKELPMGADTIIIGRILHDWNDEKCIKILKNIYSALEETGKLLILETVVPEDSGYDIGVTLNFNLLVNVGGKERNLVEFENLLQKAGFKIVYVKNCKGTISLIVVEKIISG